MNTPASTPVNPPFNNREHSRERTYRTHAVVLRRRDQGDADRVLTLFTPAQGKLDVIAKGIRKTTSRKAGHLELFTHSALLIAQARTWDIVTEAVTVESFRHLREQLEAIAGACYVCELVDCFTEADDDSHALWELLLLALRELDGLSQEDERDQRPLLRWFELHLLSATGFEPQLFNCLGCDEVIQPVANFLSVAEGGIYCPACAASRADVEAVEVDVLKVLRYLQSQQWDVVRSLTVRPPILLRVENILRRYLLSVIERQFKSADFLHRLQTNKFNL